ncbi:hypothetical protein SO802_033882 [Lithocarpus litseifolius]|uniref:Uncharacterized protein n=1 Tax=Lithocarpus litseifolius TaxID=425828 RepID=A0AAW2BF05_9ROSI
MKDSVRKIKTIKSVTSAKKIKAAEPVTLAKNIVSISIESVSASVSIPVKSVSDSFPVEFALVESVENSFPFSMIFDSAYLLALNVFIFEIVVFIESFLVVSEKWFSHSHSLSFLVNNPIY